MNAFKQVDADILIQEFIKESSGVDIRAIVVGKRWLQHAKGST